MSDLAALREQRDHLTARIRAMEDGTLVVLAANPEGVTSRDLADALWLSMPAANNRLSRLLAARVVTRRRVPLPGGGRLYCYRLSDGEDRPANPEPETDT